MTRNLLLYNEIEQISKFIDKKNNFGLFQLLKSKGDIIDLLNIFKNTIFDSNENITFKIELDSFTGDLLLSREEFLNNIPERKSKDIEIDNLKINLGYPRVYSKNFSKNIFTSIKKINNIDIDISDIELLSKYIPVKTYKKIFTHIKANFIEQINNIFLYKTKSEKYKKKIEFNLSGIYELLYHTSKYSYEYLTQLKLVLMRDGNFRYEDFNNITVDEAIYFYKSLQELNKETDE